MKLTRSYRDNKLCEAAIWRGMDPKTWFPFRSLRKLFLFVNFFFFLFSKNPPYKLSNMGKVPNCEGMYPARWFEWSSLREIGSRMNSGKGRKKEKKRKKSQAHMDTRVWHNPNSVGMVPENWLLFKFLSEEMAGSKWRQKCCHADFKEEEITDNTLSVNIDPRAGDIVPESPKVFKSLASKNTMQERLTLFSTEQKIRADDSTARKQCRLAHTWSQSSPRMLCSWNSTQVNLGLWSHRKTGSGLPCHWHPGRLYDGKERRQKREQEEENHVVSISQEKPAISLEI